MFCLSERNIKCTEVDAQCHHHHIIPYCGNVSQRRYSPQVRVCVAMRASIKVIQLCWIMLSDLIWIRLSSISGLEPPGCPISARSRASKLPNLNKCVCANVSAHCELALVSASELLSSADFTLRGNAAKVVWNPKKSNLGLLRLGKEICPISFFFKKKKGAWRVSKTCLWPIYSPLYGMELCALLPRRSHVIVNSGTLYSLDSLSGETENPSECRLQQRAFL